MNANELADELVWIAKNRGDSISRQLADIVRQQQAEKEALNKTVKRLREDIDLPASDIEEFVLHKYEYFAKCKTIASQQAEIEMLKAFVKPIIAHGEDCIGNWDGDELQDLAVKTGLLIEVEKTQFCNLDKEEFIGCACREYHYDEESWVCLNTAKFLLGEAQEK